MASTLRPIAPPTFRWISRLVNAFKLAGGARYEHFSVNGTGAGKPVFRLGANYQVAEATFLRSSFGQGFRFPTIAERYIRTGLGALQIYPNEELRPEFSWSAEVALKQGFAFKNTRIGDIVGFFDLALFRQDYEDFIEFTFGQWGPDEGEVPSIDNVFGLGFMSANTGGSSVTGAETSITGRWTTRKFQADFITGYTYTNPISTTPDTTTIPNPMDWKRRTSARAKTQRHVAEVPFTARIPI